MISFDVHGRPAPQGSKRHLGGGRMIEQSKYVKPWRNNVFAAAITAKQRTPGYEVATGPVRLDVTFAVARPKSHYRSGKFARLLRPDAPTHPAVAPDLSKLVRSTEDAITEAGLWKDDALVTHVVAAKVYIGDPSGPSQPGARITIREVTT